MWRFDSSDDRLPSKTFNHEGRGGHDEKQRGLASHGSLADGGQKHHRIGHGENEFARGNRRANGIEGSRGFARHRRVKFNGVRKDVFDRHPKEPEFRFNLRGGGLHRELPESFRRKPIFSVAESDA
ncbi:MAG: hypothetical protein LBI87_07650 [Candidatus Accumulibacter sp.]|nr:hypothetical protein [Accumulibacter sp.]